MSKHKLIFVGVIFLIVVLVVLVYCFFEKRERVIEESIHQLETANGFIPEKSNQFFLHPVWIPTGGI